MPHPGFQISQVQRTLVGTEKELGSLDWELVATITPEQAVGTGSPRWGTGCHMLGTGIPCSGNWGGRTGSQVPLTGSLAVSQWALRTGTGYPRLGTSHGASEWVWVPSMAQLDGTGHPVWHGQAGLGVYVQRGTAGWHWLPSTAWPGGQDWLPSMAQLDGTGCPVWHGLIGLRMEWAPSPLAQWPPVPPEQGPGHQPGTASGATTLWQPGCPKGVTSRDQDVPRGVTCQDWGVPRVSHPTITVSSGMFHPRASMSQGCHIPGPGFSQGCHIPYWDVPRNILLALGCQDGDPGDGDAPQGNPTHRMDQTLV